MSAARSLFLVVLLIGPLVACGAVRERGDSTAGYSNAPGGGSGFVLSGPSMWQHGGNLLSYLQGRISGMTVDQGADVCPKVTLRGQRSIFGNNDPVVYVDGARTANSCVLESLYTGDLRRVEVYPFGVSHRPGYEAHPNGLILVFLDDGTPYDNSGNPGKS